MHAFKSNKTSNQKAYGRYIKVIFIHNLHSLMNSLENFCSKTNEQRALNTE